MFYQPCSIASILMLRKCSQRYCLDVLISWLNDFESWVMEKCVSLYTELFQSSTPQYYYQKSEEMMEFFGIIKYFDLQMCRSSVMWLLWLGKTFLFRRSKWLFWVLTYCQHFTTSVLTSMETSLIIIIIIIFQVCLC